MSASPPSEPGQLRRSERIAIAANPDIAPRRLVELSKDPSWRVRRAVAGNPSTPSETLVALTGDPASRVRIRLAANPSTASEALSTMIMDESSIVRERVAANPRTRTEPLLQSLLGVDDNIFVVRLGTLHDRARDDICADERILRRVEKLSHRHRHHLARSANTPGPVLERLAADSNRGVAALLADNPNITVAALELLADSREGARLVAAHPLATGELLTRLVAEHGRGAVSALVAANGNVPVELQAKLAASPSWYVRAALAANGRASAEIVNGLVTDRHWAVRHHLAGSRIIDEASSRRLATDLPAVRLQLAGNASAAADVLNRLLVDEDQWVRGVAARHGTDAALLSQAADGLEGPGWVLRGIAANSSCPIDLADQLGAWLVLGGGVGDPDFDPVTCTGRPPSPDNEQLLASVYQELSGDRAIGDPHPLAVARGYQGAGPLRSQSDIRTAVADPDPRVRLMVLQRSQFVRKGLRARIENDDPDPVVARATKRSGLARRTTLAKASDSTASGAFAIFVLAAVIGLSLALLSDDGATTTSFETFRIPTPTLSGVPLSELGEEVSTPAGATIGLYGFGLTELVLQTEAVDEPIEIRSVRIIRSVQDSNRPGQEQTGNILDMALDIELRRQLPLLLEPGDVGAVDFVRPFNMEAVVVEYLEGSVVRTVEIPAPAYPSYTPSTSPTSTTRPGS